MLTFLLEEGVISVAAVSGIFTATLLGSLKGNILDPIAENIAPSHQLDKHAQPDILNANKYTKSEYGSNKIKWQTFLKDLIIWIIIMFILYLIWKKLISRIKNPN